jgi:ATP-dependent DNA helicase PIF1
VKRYHFTKNMRLLSADAEDQGKIQQFPEWLLEIGNGLIDEVLIPDQFVIKGSISELIDQIYPDVLQDLDQSAILAATNQSVDTINNEVLKRIPGNSRSYFSCDEVANETGAYPVDFLNQLNISGLPPHQLQLKIGAVVMLFRNLNPSKRLMNGTRMKVLQLMDRVIKVKILTGANVGSVHFIPRIKLIPSDSTLSFEMSRMQFPVKLAYAMTINKSQGQSLNRVGLFLDNYMSVQRLLIEPLS